MSEDQTKYNFAYVLSCADPAIKPTLTRTFDERFGSKGYFWIPELGGVKDIVSPKDPAYREHIFQKIHDAKKVHSFGLIVLVNHSDCGAYRLAGNSFGDSREEETFHAEELKKAEDLIRKEFPDVAVERHYFLKGEQRTAW